MMKLQIESVDIRDVKAAQKTRVSDHIVYIDLQELEELILEDGRIRSVSLDLVSPGDRARIVNLDDVIQPRCKIDRENEDFPGWLSKMKVTGNGRTRSLNGIAVLVSNPCTIREYAALLDMSGPGAIGPYTTMNNICVSPMPAANVDDRDFENAVKAAGLKTAVYLAGAAEGHPVDDIETFDLHIPESGKDTGLPRVAYYYQMYTPQRDFYNGADPVFYGRELSGILPTVVHPNEILDGGIVNMHKIYGLDTYSIQNHPIVKALYKRHGKDLVFAGAVIGIANMDPVLRQRKAMVAASLISNVLGADGVILTKILGGLVQVDLGLVAEACEQAGVKTVYFVSFNDSNGALEEQITFFPDCLDAAINVGQSLEWMRLEMEPEKIIGGTPETRILHPAGIAQTAGDRIIEVEQSVFAGGFCHIGGLPIMAVDY
jgi:glycine reductase